jgi:hypothetical protein
MTFDEAKQLLRAFEQHGVEYVLVGSMAMAVHGVVRATRDIDFFVRPSEQNIDRLKRALRAVYEDASIDEISHTDLAGDYPAIQYVPPDGDYSIDILARLGEAFQFDDLDSETVAVDDVTIRVATPRTLVDMKKNTIRPQDKIDAAALADRFALGDG